MCDSHIVKTTKKRKQYIFACMCMGTVLACFAILVLRLDIKLISDGTTSQEIYTPVDLTANVRVIMAGDHMLHSPLNRAAKTGDNTYDYTQFLDEISQYIDGDLNITDIEGPVDSFGDNKNISSYPNFNYPIELLDALKFQGFDFVITANNHAYDKGWTGLLAMREKLAIKELEYLGTYASQEEYDTPYIKEINGIKVGISAWSALDNGISFMVAGHEDYAMKKFNQDKLDDVPQMLEDISALRDAGAEVVLMALHWGAEYQDQPTNVQRQISQKLAEGGVDVIIGNHTHCVQPIEIYENEGKKTIVIYSLGNFFADQIDLSTPIPKTQYGMLVSMEINRDKDGNISVDSAKYMPTFCYRDSSRPSTGGTSYRYILAPAGKYANMDAKPIGLSDKLWLESKKAWDHVRRVVGTDISVYDGL